MNNNKRVLVTGGAGYIGAHTAVELIQAGYEAVIVDNLSRSDRTLLDGIEKIVGRKPDFIQGDCNDTAFLDHLFSSSGPFTCVLHFAAFKSVGESVQEPLLYHRNNVGSMISLLETMKRHGVSDIIFSSSCTVYGQPDRIPVDENTPFKKAESPYGATKQVCERILEDCHALGFRIVSLRYFNPIGAHPSALIGELPIGIPNNLVPYMTQTAARRRDKLTVFGNDYSTPDGSCIRDFIHVVDVAVAHIKAMEYLRQKPKEKMFEAFNLGTGQGTSVLELIQKFEESTGIKIPYVIGPRRPGDVEKVYADPSRLNRAFNWKTRFTVSEGLLHAWQWEKKLHGL